MSKEKRLAALEKRAENAEWCRPWLLFTESEGSLRIERALVFGGDEPTLVPGKTESAEEFEMRVLTCWRKQPRTLAGFSWNALEVGLTAMDEALAQAQEGGVQVFLWGDWALQVLRGSIGARTTEGIYSRSKEKTKT